MGKLLCIHNIPGDRVCGNCDQALVTGAIAERRTFTRQRLYQLRRYSAGDCVNCGKKRGKSRFKRHCTLCGEKQVKRIRDRIGAKAWEKGKAGRPPKQEIVVQ
jgi:hypothetical protein